MNRAQLSRRPPAQEARPAWVALGLALLAFGTAGCERTPLNSACPEAIAGELVLTEFRGPQDGSDTYGQWIELHNASDHSISLGGLQVRALDLDGGGETVFLVRDGRLELAAGGYAVLGGSERDPLPDHLDYSFAQDGITSLRAGAIVTLEVCGEVVDQTLYRSLPGEGTWALNGSDAPDAELNDDEDRWCADATPADPDAPMTELGVPGTPGEANPECEA